MVPFAQMLGRLDQSLIKIDEKISQPPFESTLTDGFEVDNQVAFSYLWVLGCYELVRDIYERCRIDTQKPSLKKYPKFSTDKINLKAKNTKELFERIRVPLAKLEPSIKAPSDSPIAYPIIIQHIGVGWQLSKDFIISRKRLSDEFLDLIITLNGENSLTIKT